MKLNPEQLRLYAITDSVCTNGRDLCALVEQAIIGGVTCIQLREKNLSDKELIQKARQLTEICHRYGVPLIVNDNYRAAVAAGADGVHVGIEDAPVSEIRAFAGDDFIIGATAKTISQALQAEQQGADYLGVGAVFPSPTKTNAVRITSVQLQAICSSVSIPVVAIGGITAENVSQIAGCGQCGIAVVSAVFGSDDCQAAARKLLDVSGL